MTVDIRAEVFSSLGHVISGDIATEYAQGTGLVKTRGSIEVVGIATPSIGRIVQLGYRKDNRVARFPVQLRVLSSFADPNKGKTIVQVGCILTLKDGAQPKPKDPNTKNENDTVPCRVYRQAIIPITAKYVAEQALLGLGIQGSVGMLQNKFSVETFDMSPGYIQVLSDLLVSESYLGYINASGTLSVIPIPESASGGPIINTDQFITFDPLGFGEIPADNIIVKYSYLKLKPEQDNSDGGFSFGTSNRAWEYSRSVGAQKTATVTGVPEGSEIPQSYSMSYTPTQESRTRYDSDNRVISKFTKSNISSFEMNASYCTACIVAGVIPPAFMGQVTSLTTYSYSGGESSTGNIDLLATAPPLEEAITLYDVPSSDGTDPEGTGADCIIPSVSLSTAPKQTVISTSIEYNESFMLLGASGVDYYVPGYGLIDIGSASATAGNIARISVNTSIVEGDFSRTRTTRRSAYCYTEQGQQGSARAMQSARDMAPTAAAQTILNILAGSTSLVWDGSDSSVRKDGGSAIERKPSNDKVATTAQATGEKLESTENIEWISGETNNGTVKEFTMPYASDDVINWSNSPISGDNYSVEKSIAPMMAQKFGKTQNALLFGNRNGISVAVPPGTIPETPLAPFYVTGGGVTGQFRTNGMVWTFDGNGLIVKIDALYSGGVGGDGTSPWISLPTQVTLPPLTVPIIYSTPAAPNSIPTPIGFDPTDPRDIFDDLPTDQPGVYEASITPTAIILPYLIAKYETPTFIIECNVQYTPYSLTPVTLDALTIIEITTDFPKNVTILNNGAFLVTGRNVDNSNALPGDPYWANVRMLVHFNGTNNSTAFVDSSPYNYAKTSYGNARLTTTDPRFGTACGTFDGSFDYVTMGNFQSELSPGEGDFTFEMWAYPNISTGWRGLFSTSLSGTSGGVHIAIDDGFWKVSTYGGFTDYTMGAVTTGVWQHLALVRNGTDLMFFVDGVQSGDTVNPFASPLFSPTNLFSEVITFGVAYSTSYCFDGKLDEFRYTQGIARYTANFTPPTAAFPDY